MTQHTQQHSTQIAAWAARLTANDLWLHYYSVGGNLDVFHLDAYLNGAYVLPVGERNTVALALNELIDELPQRPKAEFVNIPLPD
jgi:hypothetical protein